MYILKCEAGAPSYISQEYELKQRILIFEKVAGNSKTSFLDSSMKRTLSYEIIL
jgi:hypothetical protein